jgi:hypothetical protein
VVGADVEFGDQLDEAVLRGVQVGGEFSDGVDEGGVGVAGEVFRDVGGELRRAINGFSLKSAFVQ